MMGAWPWRCAWGGALVLLLVLAPCAGGFIARAQPTQTRMRLEVARGPGAEPCADAEALAGSIAERLGYDPVDPSASLEVRVALDRRSSELRARIEVRGTRGHAALVREIASRSARCDEIGAATALAIAIMLDPIGHPADEPADPAPPPATVPPSPRPPAAPPPPRRPVRTPRPPPAPRAAAHRDIGPRTAIAVSLDVSSGLTPGIAAGAALSYQVRWRNLRIGAEVHASLPSSERAADGSGVRAHTASLALWPCVAAGPWSGCVAARLGVVWGRGFGVEEPLGDESLLVAAGLRGGVELPLGDALALCARVELLGALTRAELYLEGQRRWSASPWLLSVGGGARLLVP